MLNAFLGLDIGGSGAKAGVFDAGGRLLGFAQVSTMPVTTPEGHTEIAIEAICAATQEAVRAAITEAGVPVRALSISSQGQTFVSLDELNQPLHLAILWYDSRAERQAAWLEEQVRVRCSGIPLIQSISTAPKILWLRERYPELMARARRYLLLPDYFTYRLTGIAVTDPNTAESTGLYIGNTPGYCPEALAAAEIGEAQLATILTSGTPIGTVLPNMAAEWGLSSETLVVAGTNDQFAGALGAGNARPGLVSETSGTCLALVSLIESLPDPVPPGLLTGRFPVPRYYFGLPYAKTAGVVLEWFRRELTPGMSLRELDTLAAAVPIGSSGVTVIPHFDGVLSPEPNPTIRGALANLSLGHGLGELYRAILESLTFSLRENVELLQRTGFAVERIRSIGGGAKSDLWLQMKADATGFPVDRPAVTEAATLGAAMLAAAGAGDFPSVEEASLSLYRTERTFVPDAEAHELYEEPYQRYRELCARLYPVPISVSGG